MKNMLGIISGDKMRLKLLLLSFLPLWTMAQTTYYIHPQGSNNGDGSLQNPWALLSYACTRVTTAGDTIHVLQGTYNDSNQGKPANGVHIVGDGQDVTKVIVGYRGGNGDPFLKYETSQGWLKDEGNQILSGITFEGNLTAYMPVIVNFRHNVIIKDCTFRNFYFKGVGFQGHPGYEWTATNFLEPDKKMPSYWCRGNKVLNCTFDNNAIYTTSGRGNIEFGTQLGFEIAGCDIRQEGREAGSNGYGITFMTEGWNRGFKIHHNKIKIAPCHDRIYNFSIETWYDLDECEIYENDLQGEVDVTGAHKRDTEYGIWIRDNKCGYPAISDHLERGFLLEAVIDGVRITDNYLYNLSIGIAFAFIWSQPPTHNYESVFNDILIARNYIVNIGEKEGGWTYGGISGIGTGGYTTGDVITNTRILNNTIVASGDYRSNTYNTAGIVLPCGVTTRGYEVKNNLIIGFKGGYMAAAPILGWATTVNENVKLDYNLIWDNANNNNSLFTTTPRPEEGRYVPGAGYSFSNNLFNNPQLTSDYKLQSTSPAINAGIDVGLPFSGTAPDIGAYEFTEEQSERGDVFIDGERVMIDGYKIVIK